MYSSLVRSLVRWLLAQLNRGRVERVARFFAPDATFWFPGESSWAGHRRGRAEITQWLVRFVEAGLQLEVLDVMVAGPPWNLRIATRFRDSRTEPDGTRVYENEGVLYDRARWGRIRHHESHEDTQEVARFDEYLAARVAPGSQPPAGRPG